MEDNMQARVAVLETEVDSLKSELDGPMGVKVVQKQLVDTMSAMQLKLASLEWKIGLVIGGVVLVGNKLLSAAMEMLK